MKRRAKFHGITVILLFATLSWQTGWCFPNGAVIKSNTGKSTPRSAQIQQCPCPEEYTDPMEVPDPVPYPVIDIKDRLSPNVTQTQAKTGEAQAQDDYGHLIDERILTNRNQFNQRTTTAEKECFCDDQGRQIQHPINFGGGNGTLYVSEPIPGSSSPTSPRTLPKENPLSTGGGKTPDGVKKPVIPEVPIMPGGFPWVIQTPKPLPEYPLPTQDPTVGQVPDTDFENDHNCSHPEQGRHPHGHGHHHGWHHHRWHHGRRPHHHGRPHHGPPHDYSTEAQVPDPDFENDHNCSQPEQGGHHHGHGHHHGWHNRPWYHGRRSHHHGPPHHGPPHHHGSPHHHGPPHHGRHHLPHHHWSPQHEPNHFGPSTYSPSS